MKVDLENIKELKPVKYIDYKIRNVTKIKKKYGFRIVLIQEDATEKTVQIGAQQIVAKPVEIINYGDGSKSNVFQTMDGAVRYVIYDSNSEFRITANNGKSLKDFASAVLSEESLLEHIKSYICCFLPDFDFEKKVYSCTTSVDVSGEHSLWREDREQFCIAEQENEEVISYTISFVEHEQGIATEDRVEILCDELGNIKNFYYCEKGIDWSVVNVDQKKLSESISEFLEDGVKSEYKPTGYTIVNQTLIHRGDKIQLAIPVEVTLSNNGREYVMLCAFSIVLS